MSAPIAINVEPISNTSSLFDVIRDGIWIARVRWMRGAQAFNVCRGWVTPHETPLVNAALNGRQQ